MSQAVPGGAADTEASDPAGAPRRWRALAVLAVVQLMLVLDATVVNVALPDIGHELDASATGLAWIVNGYLIAAGGLLLAGGRCGDLTGRRRAFAVGTVVFALASLLAALAPTMGLLVTARVLQGVGEALASPAALALISVLFVVPAERARAFGVWGALAGAGSVLGVIVSGVIVDAVGWRWIFVLNLPIAAIGLALLPHWVPPDRRVPGVRVDWLGTLLVTAGIVALVEALLALGAPGPDPRLALSAGLPGALGVLLLTAFVVGLRRRRDPLIPPRFFADRTRSGANAATVLLTGAVTAMYFLVTLYVQDVLGYSPLRAALLYLPFCAMFMIGLALGSMLGVRLGLRGTIVVALVVTAVGMGLLGWSIPGPVVTALLPGLLVIALGVAIGMPTLQNAALYGVPERDAGLASGVQTTVQQCGNAVGLAALVSLATGIGVATPGDPVPGFGTAFEVAAGTLVVGAVVFALWVTPRAVAGHEAVDE